MEAHGTQIVVSPVVVPHFSLCIFLPHIPHSALSVLATRPPQVQHPIRALSAGAAGWGAAGSAAAATTSVVTSLGAGAAPSAGLSALSPPRIPAPGAASSGTVTINQSESVTNRQKQVETGGKQAEDRRKTGGRQAENRQKQ
jgi:hypothetical protein